MDRKVWKPVFARKETVVVYSLLADLVVVGHVAYAGFIVLGQIAILLGWWRGWGWVRNPWFRGIHLTMIVIVAVEALLTIPCPLTVWEANLRELAGEEVVEGTFIGRLLDWLLFYNFPDWALVCLHVGFALLVIGTLWLVPPRWRRTFDRPALS
jgi:hypothetical protein